MNPTNLAVGDKFTDSRGVTWEVVDVIDASQGQYALKEWIASRTVPVSNKAAIASLTDLSDGDLVVLLGYTSAGDGGYRRLWYDVDGAQSVDDVEVFLGPGGVGRCLALDTAYGITLKQGGCVGDGTTNDHARAVAVIAVGKPVILDPKTTFAINGTLTASTAYQEFRGTPSAKLKQLADAQTLFSVTANYVLFDGVRMEGYGAPADPVNNATSRGINAENVIGLAVRNCMFHNWAYAGIRMLGVKDAQITDNIFTGGLGALHDSSSDIQTWGSCDGLTITGNFCLSDTDVGIMVGSLAGDNLIAISNNVVATSNTSGVFLNPTNRRRCIAVGYQTDGDALTDVVVANNLCWGSINAGIYFIGKGGSYTITGNRVGNTSISAEVGEESLSGGIVVLGSARTFVVSNNDVSGNNSDTTGCISVNKYAGTTANLGSVIVANNQCHDSASHGISVRGETDRLIVHGNEIWKCDLHGIIVASDGSFDAKMLRFSHNMISVALNTASGIWVDTQGGTNQVVFESNMIEFTGGTKGTFIANSGIYSQRENIDVYFNEIRGFKGGLYVHNGLTGRIVKQSIDYNNFINNDSAIALRGSTNHTVAFVGCHNRFTGNTANSGDEGGYYDAVRIGEYDRIADKFTYYGTAAPTLWTSKKGDRVINSAPAASGASGWTCVTDDATPGTWVTTSTLGA